MQNKNMGKTKGEKGKMGHRSRSKTAEGSQEKRGLVRVSHAAGKSTES